jgi:hypothetical protein
LVTARCGERLAPDVYSSVRRHRMRQTVLVLEWEQTTIDARDPTALGRWWATALRWTVINDAPDEFEIRAEAERLPGILFEPVTSQKQGKTGCTSICGLTTKMPRSNAYCRSARPAPTSVRASNRGLFWQTPRVTNSACFARGARGRPSDRARL